MALSIAQVLQSNSGAWVIAIMGKGHMEYGLGVTERIPQYLKNQSININPVTLTVRNKSEPKNEVDKIMKQPPADYVVLYPKVG